MLYLVSLCLLKIFIQSKNMLQRIKFDYILNDFELEFKEKYTEKRRNLLYSSVSFLSEMQFYKTWIQVILKYNRNKLPTIKEVLFVASSVAPQHVKKPETKDFKLKAV